MHYQDVDTIWLNCLYVFLSLHTDIYFEPEWKMKSTDLRTTLNGRENKERENKGTRQWKGKFAEKRYLYLSGLYDQLCPVSVLP